MMPMKTLVPWVLVGALACSGPTPVEKTRSLELTPCQLSAPGTVLRQEALCGQLEVPENRAEPDGRKLSLRVAVLEAVSRDPAPDPLFLLAGGPGQAATEAFLPMLAILQDVRQKRDLVLVDQRGTGSSNPLDCPVLEDEEEWKVPSDDELRQQVRRCLEALDGDPRFYTTAVAMDDLDAVRQALGYERINLYGVSYGTRTAQTYLKLYPDRVRAIILDGVVPQDLAVGETWARDAQHALDLILARCAGDEACKTAFPSLSQDLDSLLHSLDGSPREVHLKHPVSGEDLEVPAQRETVVSIFQRFSYTPETVALLPLLVDRAVHHGDLATLLAQGVLVGQAGGSMSQGMTFSVLCAEDIPFYDAARVAELNAGTYYGDLQTRILGAACAEWPRGEIPPDFKEPVRSDLPVLLLSGEADPVTPPSYAEQVAAGFSNHLHLVAPDSGHGVLSRGCLPKIAQAFLEAGSVAGLETDCVAEIRALPFFLNPSGPAP
jgi:pimeloyl-ACP methyl ester carboxylesterase